MLPPLHCKELPLLMATAASSATASARVDTLGFEYVEFEFVFPKATATNSSAKWGVLKIADADTTTYVATNTYVKLSGTTNTVTDATNGFVIAAQNDNTNPQVTKILVDCRGKRRYLFPVYQAADSHSTVCIKAKMWRGAIGPSDDTTRGVGVTAQG